jgi:GT2 family glycosyltransferase
MTLTTPARPGQAQDSVRRPLPARRQVVVAVLVAHDGSPWLPRTLAAVSTQTRPPDLVVAVDTGSTDDTPALLAQALGEQAVVRASRTTGFGQALALGLARVDELSGAERGGEAVSAEQDHWVWVLHDDGAPQPAALEQLVEAGVRSPSAGVLGCKLVDWDDEHALLEAGLTVGRGGRRDPGVDAPERDQGQHDGRSDVLAVPSAGMLVRRPLWDELGGFDPALPLLRDDIDLCWRAHLAGRRVLLVPAAAVADAQASTRGLRHVDAVRHVARVDRQHGLHVALARASWFTLPLLVVWLVLVGLFRAVLLLAAKSPGRAWGEVRALASVLLRPWRWIGSRWRARGSRQVGRTAVSPLLTPRFDAVRHAVDVVGGWTTRPRSAGEVDADATPAESGPTDDEALSAPVVAARWPRRLARHPLSTVLLVVAATTGLAWRHLLGPVLSGRSLTGGELRASGGDAAGLWASGLDGVRGTGLGTDQGASPGALVHALVVRLLEVVAGGRAGALAVGLVLLLAPLAAAATAYVGGRAATSARLPRAWAALVWAAAPVLVGAVDAGRLGPVLAAVGLPLVAGLSARALTRRAAGTVTALFAAALGWALLAAAVPLLALLGVLVALGGIALARGGARVRALGLLVLPVALLGPWVRDLVAAPRGLLGGAGAVADAAGREPFGLPAPVLDAVTRVTGRAPTLPAAWHDLVALPAGSPLGGWVGSAAAAPLVLVALLALARRGSRGRVVLVLWALAVVALAAALWLPGVRAGRSGLTAWAGSALLVLAGSLVAATLTATDGLRRRLGRHRFGWRQVALAPVVLLAVATPLAVLAGWAWQGVDAPTRAEVQPLSSTAAVGLPAVAQDAATGPDGVRTLVLSVESGLTRYRLDGGEPSAAARDLPAGGTSGGLGAGAVLAATRSLADVSATVAGAPAVASLQQLSVGFVLVRRPVPPDLAQRLDSTPGLARIGSSGQGQLWRVGSGDQPAAARVQLLAPGSAPVPVPVAGPHGRVSTTIGAGSTARTLVLSEAASARWRATLDGRVLTAVTLTGDRAWQQAFVLPATGGALVVTTEDPDTTLWRWVQLGLVLLCLLLALPVRRPNGQLR